MYTMHGCAIECAIAYLLSCLPLVWYCDGVLSQRKLASVELMATSNMVQWLDELETSTTGCFRKDCVAGVESDEAAAIYAQLNEDIGKERQPALAKNSERLREQARDLKVQCVEDAKVCECICVVHEINSLRQAVWRITGTALLGCATIGSLWCTCGKQGH